MSEEQQRQPRTWVPLAAAGAVAGAVLIGAVGWSVVAGGPSDLEAAAIEACEAVYLESGGPAIRGGEVYEGDEFADYYAVAQTHGDVPVPLDEVPQEQRDLWADAAEAYQDTGDGSVVVVWRLADDTYRQCSLEVDGGAVARGSAVVSDLAVDGPVD